MKSTWTCQGRKARSASSDACAAQVWPIIAAWFGLPAYESLRQPLPLLMMKHDVRPSLPILGLQGHMHFFL